MSTQPKPFGIRLKQPGQRKDEAPCPALGYPADGWDGELTYVHDTDMESGHWSVFLPHHCDEWVIAAGSREDVLAEARRFRDELDLAIGLLAGEIIPDALAAAAAAHLNRDALWENPPPLAGDCEHDFRCRPVIEPRQTVLCAKCGGFSGAWSTALTKCPGMFTVDGEGRITATGADGVLSYPVPVRRRDPAEAARLIRERYREHGIPEELAEAMIEEMAADGD